jgi:S-formylglutathione hydrolase FrmB
MVLEHRVPSGNRYEALFVMKTVLVLVTGLLGALPTWAQGTVSTETFYSPALDVQKAYRIYLPEGYAGSSERYPVIYLLHGLGVTETAWTQKPLDLAGTADAMKLKALVVMPDGDRSFYANSVTPVDYGACLHSLPPGQNKAEKPAEFCVRFPRYEDYIAVDLIQHIDGKYRTVAKREARAASGESAGGFGAMELALRHKELFGSVASHSGFFSLLYVGPHPYKHDQLVLRNTIDPNIPILQERINVFGRDVANWRAHDPLSLVDDLKDGELAIYFDCGEQDQFGFFDQALLFHDRLTERGIRHDFESIPGRHDEALWAKRIKYSLQFHADYFGKAATYPKNGN